MQLRMRATQVHEYVREDESECVPQGPALLKAPIDSVSK